MSFLCSMRMFQSLLFSLCLLVGYSVKAKNIVTSDVPAQAQDAIGMPLSDVDMQKLSLKVEEFIAKQLAISPVLNVKNLEDNLRSYIEEKMKNVRVGNVRGSNFWRYIALVAGGVTILTLIYTFIKLNEISQLQEKVEKLEKTIEQNTQDCKRLSETQKQPDVVEQLLSGLLRKMPIDAKFLVGAGLDEKIFNPGNFIN
ncbi:MAG: hypothetical protein ABH827_06095 [bacterium]